MYVCIHNGSSTFGFRLPWRLRPVQLITNPMDSAPDDGQSTTDDEVFHIVRRLVPRHGYCQWLRLTRELLFHQLRYVARIMDSWYVYPYRLLYRVVGHERHVHLVSRCLVLQSAYLSNVHRSGYYKFYIWIDEGTDEED